MQENLECRRVRPDRRTASWRSLAWSFVKHRRQGERRSGQLDAPAYVDVYGPKMLLGALLLLLFSVLDAYFTLLLIQHGSSELNPFLAKLLEKDEMWFFASKYLITAICVIWLVTHKKFIIFGIKGRHILSITIGIYGVLIVYQLSMLARLH